jgi:hypothetical protein
VTFKTENNIPEISGEQARMNSSSLSHKQDPYQRNISMVWTRS